MFQSNVLPPYTRRFLRCTYLRRLSTPLNFTVSLLFCWLLQVRFARIPDETPTVWTSSDCNFWTSMFIIFDSPGYKKCLIIVARNWKRTSEVAASDKFLMVQRQLVTNRWEGLFKWFPSAWNPPAWTIPSLLSFEQESTLRTRDVVHKS